LKCLFEQGIPQQPGTGQIGRLIEFFPGFFVFKNENVKVKVEYGFVLHTGFAGSPLLLKDYPLLLENEWNALFLPSEDLLKCLASIIMQISKLTG